MNSKYPNTTGYYVYVHVTPEKDCYFGMSKQQPSLRWRSSLYKNKSLQHYIEQFGWDNIEHRVLFDNLTKHQAEVLEDWFIKNAKRDGFCINKQRSGGIERDNPKEYQREYSHNRWQNDPEFREKNYERNRKRYQNDPEFREQQCEYYRNRYQNDPEFKTRKIEYNREYRQRPEVKERRREYARRQYLKKKALQQ